MRQNPEASQLDTTGKHQETRKHAQIVYLGQLKRVPQHTDDEGMDNRDTSVTIRPCFGGEDQGIEPTRHSPKRLTCAGSGGRVRLWSTCAESPVSRHCPELSPRSWLMTL